jgi:hypothetical protein
MAIRRGQKPKLTPEFIEQAAQLKGDGLNNQDICAALGVSTAAFYGWIQTEDSDGNPLRKKPLELELMEALKNAEADFKRSLLRSIRKAGRDKDWKAHAWMLERIYPGEFGRVDRVQAEVKQQTTAAVAVTHFFDYGDEEE